MEIVEVVMENNYKEVFCMSCFGTQRQLYIEKIIIENKAYDKFVCCMCGHENNIEINDNR